MSPYPDGGGAGHRPSGNSELKAEIEHEMQTQAATDPETLDTTLLIHPAVMGDFLDFHFLLAAADAAIRRLELDGIIQIASLHPNHEFAVSDPDDIDNYTNRVPYPTLHLLREASIDRAVTAFENRPVFGVDRNRRRLTSPDGGEAFSNGSKGQMSLAPLVSSHGCPGFRSTGFCFSF